MCKCYKYNSPGIQSKKIILYEFPNCNLYKKKIKCCCKALCMCGKLERYSAVITKIV